MGALIRFEFKKILSNKAGMVACTLALFIIIGITLLDVFATRTYDQDGKMQSGIASIDAYRTRQLSHAGELDATRVADDLATYDRAHALAQSEDPAYSGMSSEQVLDAYGFEFWRDSYAVLHDAYYTRLHSAMLVGEKTYAKDLKEGSTLNMEIALREGLLGYYSYAPSERSLWTGKLSEISWPLEYGYADGWVTSFNWTTFLALAIVALCVALSGVFSSEYQNRTASIVLPTVQGKRALPLAKVMASLAFATLYWWLTVAIMLCTIFLFFGTEGGGLPFQMMGFTNPYPLTMARATALRCVLGYVIALGMASLTLLLSSKMRTAMPVAAISMAIVLLGLVGLFFTPTSKVAVLTPLSGLTWSFSRMVSYAVGPVAADLPTVLAVLYGIMLVLLAPLAMRTFKRHQVA